MTPTPLADAQLLQTQRQLPAPFGGNIGLHVGDTKEDVLARRKDLEAHIKRPIQWLEQVHGNHVVEVDKITQAPVADGLYTQSSSLALAVMTADCLPILITDTQGTECAALHGGWRSLAAGIIERGLAHFKSPPEDCIAWLGPAIGPCHFAIGEDVKAAFLANSPRFADAFSYQGEQLFADLAKIATLELNRLGILRVNNASECTFCQPNSYFSYRRENHTGRMASLIWLNK